MIETRLTEAVAEEALRVGVARFQKLVQKGEIPKPEGYIAISLVNFATVEAEVLQKKVFGDSSNWDFDYEGLAMSKTLTSVRNRMSMGKLLKHPEKVMPGDVKYSGNTLVGNIDITCSSSASGDIDEKITKKMAKVIRSFLKEDLESQLQDESTHFIT